MKEYIILPHWVVNEILHYAVKMKGIYLTHIAKETGLNINSIHVWTANNIYLSRRYADTILKWFEEKHPEELKQAKETILRRIEFGEIKEAEL